MTNALTELRSSLERLRFERREIALFFRNDDVAGDEPSLRKLLGVFLAEDAPVNLQIIPAGPAGLTRAGASLLLEHWRARPDLFELNQHGWRHVNHERAGRQCEFGPSRSFAEQLADIASGRKILEEALGEAFSPVFTPPWNRCTAETLSVLDRLGYRGFSGLRKRETVSGYGFSDVSVTFDLFHWQPRARMKSVSEIVNGLSAQLRELDTIGIMLHHQVMDDDGFEFLALLLRVLSGSRAINLQLFQSLVC